MSKRLSSGNHLLNAITFLAARQARRRHCEERSDAAIHNSVHGRLSPSRPRANGKVAWIAASRRATTLLAVTLAGSMLASCKEEVVHVGDRAPELAAVTLQGEPVKLANWKGQTIYLNFWSAGCGACMAEMKDLEKLSTAYRGKVTVVSVNLDPQEMPIDGILQKQGVTYPIIRDSLMMTRERYLIVGTPTSFFIGPDGVVKKMMIGAQKPEVLAALFDQAAKGAVN